MFRKLAEAFAPTPRIKMKVDQPDRRIPVTGLGAFALRGEGDGYVSHRQPGCPRNAIIEYFESRNYIRCGFCSTALTPDAAIYVLDNSTMTEQNTFLWMKGRCPITSPART